jgi:GntR family transcriptional repressor for pyruvate dehydrogenase complex
MATNLAPKFKAIKSPRAFEEIAEQIRREISEGRLKVDDKLPSERELSEKFKVSRNTLREALRALEHAGIIRLQKGATGGAFISEHGAQAIAISLLDLFNIGSISPQQLTEARIWLETIIVREACHKATATDIAELHQNIDLAELARKNGDFSARAKLNLEFHRILTRINNNPIMFIVMNGLLNIFAEFIEKIGAQQNTFVSTSRKKFMRHLENKEVQEAILEMESSLKRLEKNYLTKIKS